MEGMADILETDIKHIYKMHIIIELYKGQFLSQSSIIGIWGDALARSEKVISINELDIDLHLSLIMFSMFILLTGTCEALIVMLIK